MKEIISEVNVIDDMETSQQFISDQHDILKTKAKSTDKQVGEIRAEVTSLAVENAKLKSVNKSLADDMIDLKCRSMRDNLLFFGITEQNRPPVTEASEEAPTQPQEDCAELVFDFCKTVLKIDDPKNTITVNRAHRIGRFDPSKVRPIVVKFKDTSSKVAVQSSLKAAKLSRETPHNVSEQYPQEVKERRKVLIPIMLQARREGKRAILVREKLYIDNVLYSPDASADASASK